jgi:hypothetical protein
VTDIFALGGSISGLQVATVNGETLHISTPNVVFATGPLFEKTLDVLKKRDLSSFDVPIINELHMRAVMDDPLQVITPTTPLTFDSDHIGHLEVRILAPSDIRRVAYIDVAISSRMRSERPSRPIRGPRACWKSFHPVRGESIVR